MRRSMAGSSRITVLLVIFVAFGAGIACWYAWYKNQGQAKQAQQTKSDNAGAKGPQPLDPSEGGKYLVIKEWGVRFELPQELRGDVGYSLNQKALDEFGVERIDFTSKFLTSSALKCDYANSTPKVVAYMVRQQNQPGEDSTLQPFAHLASWYYMADSQCKGYLTDETRPLLDNFLAALNRAIKLLEVYDIKE